MREQFYNLAPGTLPIEKKAFVDELITRVQNAIHSSTAPVKVTTHQDRPDAAHIHLTTEQANTLLSVPDVDTLRGLRDTAILALMLCMGLREAELCALDVDDLRQRLGGTLALPVRVGKGAKERLSPMARRNGCWSLPMPGFEPPRLVGSALSWLLQRHPPTAYWPFEMHYGEINLTRRRALFPFIQKVLSLCGANISEHLDYSVLDPLPFTIIFM